MKRRGRGVLSPTGTPRRPPAPAMVVPVNVTQSRMIPLGLVARQAESKRLLQELARANSAVGSYQRPKRFGRRRSRRHERQYEHLLARRADAEGKAIKHVRRMCPDSDLNWLRLLSADANGTLEQFLHQHEPRPAWETDPEVDRSLDPTEQEPLARSLFRPRKHQ